MAVEVIASNWGIMKSELWAPQSKYLMDIHQTLAFTFVKELNSKTQQGIWLIQANFPWKHIFDMDA